MKYKLHKRVMFMAAITLIVEVWCDAFTADIAKG